MKIPAILDCVETPSILPKDELENVLRLKKENELISELELRTKKFFCTANVKF